MKSFKSIIALVLCAVMLVGIVPMAFKNNEVAADEPETTIDAVIQGPNDAVVVYDNAAINFRSVFGAFVGNRVLNSAKAYDRIILVIAVDTKMGTGATAFESGTSSLAFTDVENIVITSKCYAEYTDNVYLYTGTGYDSLMPMNTAIAFGKATNPFTDNLIDKTDVSFTFIDKTNTNASYIRFACDMAFEYITLNFSAHNVLYLSGYDFYIADTVKFTHTYGTTAGFNPVVVNGSNTNSSFDMGDSTQVVTLNAGTYQYISLRTRDNYRTYKDMDITLNLGDITVVNQNGANQTAFLANDIYDGVTMTVNIDGATFEKPVYLLGGTQTDKSYTPSVTDTVLNVNIKSGTFEQGIYAYLSKTNGSIADYTVNGLTINVDIDECILGTGCTIAGEDAAFADKTTSTITYPAGATYASSVVSFDTVKTKTVSVCEGEHSPSYALVDDKPACICSKCFTEIAEIAFKEGYPVVYVGSTGSASNDGVTADTPVSKIWQAFEILANWNMGGYIQLVANVTETADHTLSTSSGTKWVNCGDLVIIDGAHGDVAASTLTCTSGQIHIFNDVEMRNIKLAAVSGHKAFALNYYNFKAVDNCTMVNPDSYYYSLMLGSTNGFGTVPDNATDRVVDQVVEIDGFSFLFISSGSKSFSLSGGKFSFSRDYSIRCSGTSKVYIGANSRVDAINVRVNNYDDNGNLNASYTAPDTTFYINKAAVDIDNVQFVQNCTSGAPTATVSGGKFTEAGFNIYCDDVTVLPRMINIVDEDAMTLDTLGYNAAGAAVRAGFKDADSFLNGDNVAEFGVLFATAENAGNIAYVSTISGAVNGVAKSRCYDKVADIHNYNYDGTNPVVFRGVLYYEDAEGNSLIDTYGDAEFVAAPYAVINVAATSTANSVAASYTVVGATTDAFSYNGLAK